jgi:hypothetical protein
MRSLDLYSEKQIRDGSPDKIAASTAFVREANSLSLSSLTKDSALGQIAQVDRGGSQAQSVERQGLLSVFIDGAEQKVDSKQRDRGALATIALCNPLFLIGMGATFAIADELKRRQDCSLNEKDLIKDPIKNLNNRVADERMQRIIARQEVLRKDAKNKADSADKALSERVNDTTVLSSVSLSKTCKFSFVKDKISVTGGATLREKPPKRQGARDVVQQKKLEKKKQMLLDYLEKFRGKLSLQEVSEVVSQIEKLDKTLFLMFS